MIAGSYSIRLEFCQKLLRDTIHRANVVHEVGELAVVYGGHADGQLPIGVEHIARPIREHRKKLLAIWVESLDTLPARGRLE